MLSSRSRLPSPPILRLFLRLILSLPLSFSLSFSFSGNSCSQPSNTRRARGAMTRALVCTVQRRRRRAHRCTFTSRNARASERARAHSRGQSRIEHRLRSLPEFNDPSGSSLPEPSCSPPLPPRRVPTRVARSRQRAFSTTHDFLSLACFSRLFSRRSFPPRSTVRLSLSTHAGYNSPRSLCTPPSHFLSLSLSLSLSRFLYIVGSLLFFRFTVSPGSLSHSLSLSVFSFWPSSLPDDHFSPPRCSLHTHTHNRHRDTHTHG